MGNSHVRSIDGSRKSPFSFSPWAPEKNLFSLRPILLDSNTPFQPYGFHHESTAEEVTAGIDLTGKTAIVTGSNTGMFHPPASRALSLLFILPPHLHLSHP